MTPTTSPNLAQLRAEYLDAGNELDAYNDGARYSRSYSIERRYAIATAAYRSAMKAISK
jgi:hypothetical protein